MAELTIDIGIDEAEQRLLVELAKYFGPEPANADD